MTNITENWKHGPNRYILILKDDLTENWNYAGSSGQLSQEYWNVQLSSGQLSTSLRTYAKYGKTWTKQIVILKVKQISNEKMQVFHPNMDQSDTQQQLVILIRSRMRTFCLDQLIWN